LQYSVFTTTYNEEYERDELLTPAQTRGKRKKDEQCKREAITERNYERGEAR